MIINDFLSSIFFAVLASMMSVLILRRSGYKIVFHWLFSLVFLAIWAGGIWIRPVGPSVGGVFFLPFVIVGFLVVISFLAFTKKDKPQGRVDTIDLIEKIQRKRDFEKISVISINIFFYFLLVFLISAVISKYILLK